jgi:Bor protein
MMNFIFSLVVLLLLTSCSTIEFNTSGKETFYLSPRPGSEKLIEVKVTKDFYFWGLTPKKGMRDFDLEDELDGYGVNQPSYVAVEQSFSFKNVLYTVVTLGLYCPVDYRVTLLSKGEEK